MALGAGKSRSRLDAGLQMAFILLCPAHGEEEEEEKGNKRGGGEEREGKGEEGRGRNTSTLPSIAYTNHTTSLHPCAPITPSNLCFILGLDLAIWEDSRDTFCS